MQNAPLVASPVPSRRAGSIRTDPALLPVRLPVALTSTLPSGAAGNVNRPTPVRVVALSAASTPLPRPTREKPGVAASPAWVNDGSSESLKSVDSGSTGELVGAAGVGRNGTSPSFAQPAPLRRRRLKPRIFVSPYVYPPPTFAEEGLVSGPHWAIPSGTVGPGLVFPAPPPVPKSGAPGWVPLNGLTYPATSAASAGPATASAASSATRRDRPSTKSINVRAVQYPRA